MNPNRRSLALETAAMLAGLATGAALAQDKWPSKPITYLVPFPVGGTTDVLARLIGQKLGTALGTTIVIDNKGGAGGSVGSEIAARAALHTEIGKILREPEMQERLGKLGMQGADLTIDPSARSSRPRWRSGRR